MEKYSYIKENLKRIRETLPKDVTLIAVTKTYGCDEINYAIEQGVTDIGENKVQEILEKYPKVNNVRWHLIGHLQTNKVKQIINKVDLIHSVDSIKLVDEINKRAEAIDKKMDILVQVNVAKEESKFGIRVEQLKEFINYILKNCKYITIKGLMTIAPFEENSENVRQFFKALKDEMDKYKVIEHSNLQMEILSMGMSGDYKVAVEEGANMVRIGSSIFGNRSY